MDITYCDCETQPRTVYNPATMWYCVKTYLVLIKLCVRPLTTNTTASVLKW